MHRLIIDCACSALLYARLGWHTLPNPFFILSNGKHNILIGCHVYSILINTSCIFKIREANFTAFCQLYCCVLTPSTSFFGIRQNTQFLPRILGSYKFKFLILSADFEVFFYSGVHKIMLETRKCRC